MSRFIIQQNFFLILKNVCGFFLSKNALLNFRYQKSFSSIKTLDTFVLDMLEFVGFSDDKKSILYVQNIKEYLNNT